MLDLFADYLGQFLWVYIDDILICSNTEEDHLKDSTRVCEKLKEVQFYVSRRKSEFFAKRINVVGYIIDDKGLKVPEKISKIENWTTPKMKWQQLELLGTMNYIRQFLRYLATVTVPLTALTGTAEFI